MLSNFVFQSPTDVAFKIFGLDIYFYGIIMAFAILAGYFVAYGLFKKYYDKEKAKYITNFSPYLILIGILGARIYYCCVNYQYYIQHPAEIFYIRQGGLSIHGMIIAGIIGLFFFFKNIQNKIFSTYRCIYVRKHIGTKHWEMGQLF